MSITVKSLSVHPVKSLRALQLGQATLAATGLEYDRHWLLIDGRDRFLSQRQHADMATISAAIRGGNSGGQLLLSHREHGEIAVPLAITVAEARNDAAASAGQPQVASDGRGTLRTTEVWGDRCEVLDEGDAAAAWLARALPEADRPRLVRMHPGYRRPQRHADLYGPETHTFFADSAPFLLASTSTLGALNDALGERGHAPVPMARFRANIVVEGLAPFDEHRLAALTGPGYRFTVNYPRERCVMITMDQRSGVADKNHEPFRTLVKLNPMPDNPRGPAFGELCVLSEGAGRQIRVGDLLEPEWARAR